jgi:hypothetical protein
MTNDYNLQFIEKKLEEAKTAVMYIGGDNVVKLPNDVVTFIKVDAEGKLWLTAHKPRCWLRMYEQSFPIRLFFYRKGIGFYVETEGIATIAGLEDVNEVKDELSDEMFLVKMKPHVVEYTETGRKYLFPSIVSWWSTFSKRITENLSFINTKHIPLSGIQKTKNYG